MRAHCLVRKLCFLRKLTDGDAECASLLGAKMLEAFGSDQKSTGAGVGVLGVGGMVWLGFH